MELRNYNKEWAEFLMNKNNFAELIKLENDQTGYIARIANSFEEIKEYGRSNRGSQNYRKVTVEMCKSYLSNSSFEGVDETNEDIAQIISSYTRNQASFDEATKIRKEYLSLLEEGKIQENIIDDIKETLDNLNEVSNNSFTYEFLSKYDPRNFVLGKYCSCCAHLEGAGYGIMKASILHPDCQNLVIKDTSGKIITKSTLYINREQGYGVFNNVEISTSIRDKQKIYNQYIEAVSEFAERYNQLNPNKPLKQINVGMGLNDLGEVIEERNQKGEILKGINFSDYGKSGQTYGGDWQREQYVIWSNDEVKKKR